MHNKLYRKIQNKQNNRTYTETHVEQPGTKTHINKQYTHAYIYIYNVNTEINHIGKDADRKY